LSEEYFVPKESRVDSDLFWKKWEDRDEMGLVRAMLEHCSDGSTIWAAISRLSAYSKIPVTKIKALIHGRKATKKHLAVRGLLERKILTLIAPANPKKHRPATYRFNEWVLQDDPEMAKYRAEEQQQVLPGITLSAVPGQPISRPGISLGANFAPGGNFRATLGRTSPEVPGANFAPGGNSQDIKDDTRIGLEIPSEPLFLRPSAPPGANFAPGGNFRATLGRTSPEPGANFAHKILRSRSKSTSTTSSSSSGLGVDVGLAARAQGGMDSDYEQILTALHVYAEIFDQKAVEQLVAACRAEAPDATAAEIMHFIHKKGSITLHTQSAGDFGCVRTIQNPVGFLLHAVPKCFEGVAFTAWRKRSRAAAASATREVEIREVTCKFCGFITRAGCKFCPRCRKEYSPAEGEN
jgi:hypothetical protein